MSVLTKAYAACQFNKHIDQQVQEGLDSIEEKKLEILPRALLSIRADGLWTDEESRFVAHTRSMLY